MEFYLTKNPRQRSADVAIVLPEGQTVCYEEPIHSELLPKLLRAIDGSDWPVQFHGHYYCVRARRGLIHDEVPASEYYKFAWRSMSQKYHGAALALRSLEALAAEITRRYPVERSMIGPTSQPKFVFSTELYSLRMTFATEIFLIRALLDELASLVQFLSGPKSRQYRSFADIAQKCGSQSPPAEVPPDLQRFICDDIPWFWRMRDVRDYFAHQGFVQIRVVEHPPLVLRFFFHHHLDVLELAREFMLGLGTLLDNVDTAFALRIRNP